MSSLEDIICDNGELPLCEDDPQDQQRIFMKNIKITTEFIKMDQLLKHADVVSSGGEAKIVIMSGQVKLNQVTVTERGKKVYPGDTVQIITDSGKVDLKIVGK